MAAYRALHSPLGRYKRFNNGAFLVNVQGIVQESSERPCHPLTGSPSLNRHCVQSWLQKLIIPDHSEFIHVCFENFFTRSFTNLKHEDTEVKRNGFHRGGATLTGGRRSAVPAGPRCGGQMRRRGGPPLPLSGPAGNAAGC